MKARTSQIFSNNIMLVGGDTALSSSLNVVAVPVLATNLLTQHPLDGDGLAKSSSSESPFW